MDGAYRDFSDEEIFSPVGTFRNLVIGKMYFEILPIYGSLIVQGDVLRYALLFKKNKGLLYLTEIVQTDFPPILLPKTIILEVFEYSPRLS